MEFTSDVLTGRNKSKTKVDDLDINKVKSVPADSEKN